MERTALKNLFPLIFNNFAVIITMSDLPVSYNPDLNIPEKISFFKEFIFSQDEVPCKIKNRDTKQSVIWVTTDKKIIQKHHENQSEIRKSFSTTPKSDWVKRDELRTYSETPLWITGIIIFVFLLTGFIRILNYNRFSQFTQAFLTPQKLNQFMREGNFLKDSIMFPLTLIQLLSMALFIWRAADIFHLTLLVSGSAFFLFLVLLGALGGLFLFRIVFVKITSWIFQTKESSNTYLVNSIIFGNILGLVLLPVILFMYFSAPPLSVIATWTGLVLIAVLLLFGFIRNFMIGLSVKKYSPFYLFLYLCTAEILPYLALGKWVVDNFLT